MSTDDESPIVTLGVCPHCGKTTEAPLRYADDYFDSVGRLVCEGCGRIFKGKRPEDPEPDGQ